MAQAAARVLGTQDESDAPDLAAAAQAACAVAWRWERGEARLALQGDLSCLGIAPADAADALSPLLANLSASSRQVLDAALGRRAASESFTFRLVLEDGRTSLWRGSWAKDGACAQGLALPEPDQAAGDGGRDRLTGLLDRSGFVSRVQARLDAGEGVRVVAADVQRFGRLNTALGPDLADAVLAALAGRITSAYPAACAPARFGEDEFALLLEPGEHDVVVPLRAALERPLRVAGCDVHPAFAVGVGEAGAGEAVNASEVLRRTAAALAKARSGEVLTGSPDAEHESQGLGRLTLENDLRGALGRGELEPFFQPIVRLADGRLAGFEALVRWRHPRRGLIPPDDFLPLLTEARLMSALGRHMLRVCSGRLAAWRAAFAGAEDLFVTVNLTVGELDRPGLVQDVAEVLSDAGLPPRAVKLELTEGELMRDPDSAVRTLDALKAVGAGLAIDDFGMGFSSLSYLTRLPVDTLKVDRYFVQTMGVSESSAKVMRSIVALGRDLGLQIVGEGVEDAAAAERLRETGCTFGQGYGYARPLSLDETETYLRESLRGGAPLRGPSGASGHA